MLSSGLNLETLIWCSPFSDAEIQEDFDMFFSKAVELTSTVYFQAGEAEVQGMYASLSKTRRCYDAFEDPMQRM